MELNHKEMQKYTKQVLNDHGIHCNEVVVVSHPSEFYAADNCTNTIVVSIPTKTAYFKDIIEFITRSADIVENIGFMHNNESWRAIRLCSTKPRPSVNGYSDDGVFYDDTNSCLQANDVSFYQECIKRFPHERVLDVACGTNRVGKELVSNGIKHYHGIDLSPVMLKYASIKTLEPYASFFVWT